MIDMGAPILKGKGIPVNLSGGVINRPLFLDGKEMRAHLCFLLWKSSLRYFCGLNQDLPR